MAQEKELFVRTPANLYEDLQGIHLIGLIAKGTKVEILGYDFIDNGKVNKYQVQVGNQSGYVYGKYLVKNEDEALAHYDEDGNYKTHEPRVDKYGGGSAGNLDFYPRAKVRFEDNVIPDETRSIYLNVYVLEQIDDYIAYAKEYNINTFVVDIKDNKTPGYNADTFKEYSPTNFEQAYHTKEEYKGYIQKLLDNDFYVVGRITCFKDSYYITDHPENAIIDTATKTPYKHNGAYWPSAYNREVWEYTLSLAIESAEEMGFHEIQFDYVRFPDMMGLAESEGRVDYKNTYNEEKAQAIQRFLMYATDELHQYEVYVSADVFGEASNNYVTAYGQYWPAISNVVDVVSSMPYPDHFNKYEYGSDVAVWEIPYFLLYNWASTTMYRQDETPCPAKARTWIQAYDTIRAPYIVYGADKIAEQIAGLYDAGLSDGYITWNGSSSLYKYYEIGPAFTREY